MDNRDKILIGCIYRHGNNGAEENENLFHVLEKICTRKYKHVLIAGDFNLPGIEWASWTTKSDYNSTEFKFIECIRNCFMEQLITSPTRGRGTNEPSVLDLVLTDNSDTVDDHTIGPPLGKSDHSTLIIDMKFLPESRRTRQSKYLYNKANYSGMREDLDIDWKECLQDKQIEQQWAVFLEALETAMKKHIPRTRVRGSSKKNKAHSTPLDQKALGKLKKKHALWKRYLNSKNGEIYLEYCRT